MKVIEHVVSYRGREELNLNNYSSKTLSTTYQCDFGTNMIIYWTNHLYCMGIVEVYFTLLLYISASSPPLNVVITATTSDSLILKWQSPSNPNGIISAYMASLLIQNVLASSSHTVKFLHGSLIARYRPCKFSLWLCT